MNFQWRKSILEPMPAEPWPFKIDPATGGGHRTKSNFCTFEAVIVAVHEFLVDAVDGSSTGT
jgi:hypothetical protein